MNDDGNGCVQGRHIPLPIPQGPAGRPPALVAILALGAPAGGQHLPSRHGSPGGSLTCPPMAPGRGFAGAGVHSSLTWASRPHALPTGRNSGALGSRSTGPASGRVVAQDGQPRPASRPQGLDTHPASLGGGLCAPAGQLPFHTSVRNLIVETYGHTWRGSGVSGKLEATSRVQRSALQES